MARKKTKKDRKKHLKEDQFRETMLGVGAQLKEYRYLILLACAVIVLFVVLLSMRAERKEKEIAYAAQLIKPGTVTGPVELQKLIKQVEGTSIEPWVLLRYGTKLYELYQKEDSLSGEKGRLLEAKSVFEDLKKRFPDNGSTAYLAGKTLELIEKELAYDPPEGLKKAYERMTNPPKRVPPKKLPKPPVPPKVKKEPEKPSESETQKQPPEKKTEAEALKQPAEEKKAPAPADEGDSGKDTPEKPGTQPQGK